MSQKQFTVEELEYLVLVKGQGGTQATSQYERGHITYHPPPSKHRDIRRDIYDVVFGAGGVVRRAEIAHLLQLKKTPWLLGHIEGLVTNGYLVRSEGTWRNGFVMYLYEVP